MAAAMSPTRDLMKRRLSIDAEDELFKSLQGVQELNNSQRKGRSVMGSPGKHSGRMNRRSIDVERAQSPGKHNVRRERRKSIELSAAGASPGSYAARRQRRNSINTGSNTISPKRNNSGRRTNSITVSPKRNNSGRRNVRGISPKRDESGGAPQPLALERQPSGGTVRKANRRRRASTGMESSPGTLSPKGRTARRSNPNVKGNDPETPPTQEKGRTKQRSHSPKPSSTPASGGPAVIRSFHRRRVISTSASPTSSPTSPKEVNNVYSAKQTTPTKSPKDSKLWKEMTMRANLIKNAKPPKLNESWASFDDDSLIKKPKSPRFNDSTTSWASLDDDIIGSDIEKESDSELTESTKPISERTAQSDRSDNRDLKSLLEKLKDPAEMERRRLERERLSRPINGATGLEHDKVAEKVSSRNLKNFLQRSKRGYGQQTNLDGHSVMQ